MLGGNKRVFFYSDEYNATINRNGIIGESIGFPKVNTDYDIRNCVRSIEMFDIEYLPAAHEAFTNDYSGKADIDFGSAVNAFSNPSILQSVKVYKPECLGKQKSDPWDYEGESRVMSCLDLQDFDEWNFIDLRLKDEIFRDLNVVMSPWAVPDLENEIQNIISSSPLCDNIKHTITVVHSELEGTINI